MIKYKYKKKIVSSIKERNVFNVQSAGTLQINANRHNNRKTKLRNTRYTSRIITINFKALEYDHWRILHGLFPFAISKQEEEHRKRTPVFTKISDYK